MNGKFFFFFSSRRRHTRYWRDWSSDVWSSDLRDPIRAGELNQEEIDRGQADPDYRLRIQKEPDQTRRTKGPRYTPVSKRQRSEERRVGKECRSRWSRYH